MIQNVDAMIETRNAREWERQNPDPFPFYRAAVDQMGNAYTELSNAIKYLSEASEAIDGYTDSYRIDSVREALEGLQDEVERLQQKFKREVKAS